MNNQPLLICTICFALGILFQEFLKLNLPEAALFLVFGIILAGVGLIKSFFFDRVKALFLLILFFCIGVFSHFLNTQTEIPSEISKGQKQHITFALNKKLNSNERYKRYKVDIVNFKTPFSVILSIPKEQKELDFNHLYSTEVYLNLIEKPQHKFQFDYQKYLARQDIYFQGYVSRKILSSEKEKISLQDRIKQQRLNLLNKIDNSPLHIDNKALLKGIILADRTEINKQILDSFSHTGLIHILAISGTHMAIIFLLFLSILKPIFSGKYRNIPIYISLLAIWAFAIFIDFGNSVVRACIMISVYYTMVFIQRKPNLLHSMALAGIIILGRNTQELFNIGFQLSFLAVFGIYWLYSPIIGIFGKIKNPILRFISNTFALSLSAQIAVAPLIIYYFHQISIMSVFFNMAIVIFAQAFIIFSFTLCLLLATDIANRWILDIYDIFATSFLKIISIFSDWDFSFVENIPMEGIEVILLFALIYLLRNLLSKVNIKTFLYFFALILIFIAIRTTLDFLYWKKEETLEHQFYHSKFISIKQGDEVIFFVDDTTKLDKIHSSIIKPYIISRRTDHFQIKHISTGSTIQIQDK